MNNFPATKNLARWLLAHECSEVNPSEETVQTAVRVCEKLRRPLSTLAGVDGYRALLSRALALAKRDLPSLGTVQVREDGTLDWPGAALNGREMDEDADGGVPLVAQLLGLLAIFIGEALTLRLVRDVWPDAPFEGIDSETEKL